MTHKIGDIFQFVNVLREDDMIEICCNFFSKNNRILNPNLDGCVFWGGGVNFTPHPQLVFP